MDQEKIGNFIAENRKNKNLTQEALAEKLGVSKNAVSKWERGLNLPDASIMPELCKILSITLNELFSGEKIPDNKYKEIADNNLLNVLENNVFTLKDKIEYFKKKWQKEHIFELIIVMIIIVFFIIYGFIKNNGLQYLSMILGFIYGAMENNRMMTYVENHVYGKKSNISVNEFKISMKRLKEFKRLVSQFKNKNEAIEFLMQETKLSRHECTEAYNFIMNTNIDKN